MVFTFLSSTSYLLNVTGVAGVVMFTIMIVGFACLILGKFPIFLTPKAQSSENFSYSRTLSPAQSIYFSIFCSQISFFTSFFSENRINANKNEFGKIKLTWSQGKVRVIHRFLDFILLVLFVPLGVWLIFWFREQGLRQYFVLFVAVTLAALRDFLCCLFSSVNIKIENGVKINVFATISNRLKTKFQGISFPLMDTALISEDIFNQDSFAKYVLAHEIGHLKDKISKIFFVFRYFFTPFYLLIITGMLYEFEMAYLAFFPLASYAVYYLIFGRIIYKNSERFADLYAAKTVGKESCLDVLKDMKRKENKSVFCKIIRRLLGIIPIDERISTISEDKTAHEI
ncbi:MAG: hypothetical protein LBH37_02825 [Oscillospiraceae bacterium]|jgi:hypothetical protein|nr:hypothetical protein [Oscillospiraceae bacterium]